MGIKAKQMNNQSFEDSVPSFGFGGKTAIRPLPNSRSVGSSQSLTSEEIKKKILKKFEAAGSAKGKEENKD